MSRLNYTYLMRLSTRKPGRFFAAGRNIRRLRLAVRRRYLRLLAAIKQNLTSKPWQELVFAQLLLALLLFASPLLEWITRAADSWYLPYLIWAMIILIAFFYQRMQRHDL